MMKQEDREILAQCMGKEVSSICIDNIRDIYEYFSCCEEMYTKILNKARHYTEVDIVVEIEKDVYFKYMYAYANNSDYGLGDIGYELDNYNWKSIKRVYPKEVTTIVYEAKD